MQILFCIWSGGKNVDENSIYPVEFNDGGKVSDLDRSVRTVN